MHDKLWKQEKESILDDWRNSKIKAKISAVDVKFNDTVCVFHKCEGKIYQNKEIQNYEGLAGLAGFQCVLALQSRVIL